MKPRGSPRACSGEDVTAARDNGPLWCLLSGGKDSVCAAHFLAQRGRLAGCVFLDTGIALPDTRPFVERLCESQGWDLLIYRAPASYEELVMRWGFPSGPVGHSWAYGWLKERGLIQAVKELGHEATFASGARRKESARRARTIVRGFRHNYRIRIENPIVDWSTPDTWRYLRENGLDVSPSYVTLGRSGDCLCGAFSQRGEADVIRRAYPAVADRLARLEARASEKFPYPKCRWGNSKRSIGGFTALKGRRTLEAFVCGGDCADGASEEATA